MALGFAGIPAQHIFILYLVAVGFHPFKEFIDSNDGVFFPFHLSALPYYVLNLRRQIAVWFKYGYSVFLGVPDKLVLEPPHFFTPPARYGSVINGQTFVRDDQIFTDSDDLPKSAAYRTGAQGAVETEQIFVRFGKFHSICLKTVDELLEASVSFIYTHRPITLVKCGIY